MSAENGPHPSSPVAPPAPGPEAAPGLSRHMVTLFAVATGLSVANIYYAHPLLTAIAATFSVGSGTAALLVTALSVGYAAGLALLVPLGDVMDRRKLIVTLMVVVAGAQVASALAPSFSLLFAVSIVLALSSITGPLLVSFAATLSRVEHRGRVTGRVMSGLLIGVLLARVAGGLIAEWGGWRSVHVVAAVLMFVLAAVLHRTLPHQPPAARMRYLPLLASVLRLLREEPVLQLRCLYGFLTFAGFSAFWTSLAFLLHAPPYSYSEATIGLFGIAGLVGAYAARIAGHQADLGRQHLVGGLMLLTLLASWVIMSLNEGHWLVALVVGVIVLDFAVQGMHVTNLSVVYGIRPEARSRITTSYMTSFFAGGVAGSAAAGPAYAAYGWHAVCLVGAGFTVVPLVLWIGETVLRRRAGQSPTGG